MPSDRAEAGKPEEAEDDTLPESVLIAPLAPNAYEAARALIAAELGAGYVTLGDVRTHADREGGCGFVAMIGDRVCGVVLAGPATPRDVKAAARARLKLPGPAAEVHTIAVAPDARRRGVARRLLTRALASLAEQGFADTLAVVWLSGANESTALFRSAGFTSVGKSPRHWYEDSIARGYDCPLCGNPCRCDAELWVLHPQP